MEMARLGFLAGNTASPLWLLPEGVLKQGSTASAGP